MKVKISRIVLLHALFICFFIGSLAQTSKPNVYFTPKQMPNMLKFLPQPPKFGSPFFVSDSVMYEWGKSQRLQKERSDIAKSDAEFGLKIIIREFSAPFGLQISEKGTPQIYKLLKDALATCNNVCPLPKQHYMRKRPFAYYDEPTLVPEHEASHINNGSYPSGHTVLGWSAALLLMEINPDAQDTLLARGYMYGESRIIAGYHWASDVEAGRLAASAAYAKLHTNKRFLKQMARAREEFARLKGVSLK